MWNLIGIYEENDEEKGKEKKEKKICERKIGRKVNICTALLIGQLSWYLVSLA